MCIDILRRCASIVSCIREAPTFWGRIVGTTPLTPTNRMEIAVQIFDIREDVEHTLRIIDRCFDEGYHSLEIALFVLGKVTYLSQWIDSIIEGRGLPEELKRA